MAGQKTFIFDPQDLYNLLVHYTDGTVPLRGVVRAALVNPYLTRMIALNVDSDEWSEASPFHIRYDGKRTATWMQGQSEHDWAEREETPHCQM